MYQKLTKLHKKNSTKELAISASTSLPSTYGTSKLVEDGVWKSNYHQSRENLRENPKIS